jgi:hypothetical protein
VPSSNALAQNRDRDRDDNGGPAFCRSGAGHPVFGWEWCRERGWDRVNGRGVQRNDDRRYYENRDDQYRNGRVYRDDRVYRNGRVNDVAFDNGYSDGYEKGLDDGRDRHSFDPTGEKWYRSGDRPLRVAYGSKAHTRTCIARAFATGTRRDTGWRLDTIIAEPNDDPLAVLRDSLYELSTCDARPTPNSQRRVALGSWGREIANHEYSSAALSQLESLDLPGGRLRQARHKLDPSRSLVVGQPARTKSCSVRRQLRAGGDPVTQHDVCRRLDEPIVIAATITPHSSTAGWSMSAFSTSTGLTHMPPTLSMSSQRPA